MSSREKLIRIPRSGYRNARPIFAKLLQKVSPFPWSGYDFSGTILLPGRLVPENLLRPPGYPLTPLLLECAGLNAGPGQKRGECLYILWRLDGTQWTEIGRASSRAWEWSLDLGPLAQRALAEASTSPVVELVTTNLVRVEKRLRLVLDRELTPLEPPDRMRLVAILHDELATRFALSQGFS